MKKNLLLTLCLLLVSFISFAGKFVMIPVTETNNLVTLFSNNELKIHYYCDDYVLATTENLNLNGTIILDNNAFTNNGFYAIVYCAEDYKNEYVTENSKSGKVLFSGKNFLIMEVLSKEFMPAINDGMVIVRNIQAKLPKSTAYPVVTEPDENVLDYLSQVSTDTLMAYIQTLQDFETRICIHPNAVLAQNWIKEKYESFGLETSLQRFPLWGEWDWSSKNVIAIQYGTEFPEEFIVCGAHYDSFTYQSYVNQSFSDAPGADDNASGVAGILETARILSQYDFKRSIIYCSFSGEELGLWGSSYFAEQCANEITNIVGYFNLDMIGYLTPGKPIHIDLIYPNSAKSLADYYFNVCDVYFPEIPVQGFSNLPWGDSDHTSFNTVGYKGIWPFEDIYENSPYIHNVPHYDSLFHFHYLGDIIGPSVNNPDQVNVFTKTNVASVATLAMYDQEMPLIIAPPVNCLAVPYLGNRIKITWEEPLEGSPEGYNVYQDGSYIAHIAAPKLECIDWLYNDPSWHCYKITAVYGAFESDFSNESCASLGVTEHNSKVNIYPNPANDKIYIECQLINHNAEIFDMSGKLIINQIINSDTTTIDISNLTTGIYFIKISNEIVGKFVKD